MFATSLKSQLSVHTLHADLHSDYREGHFRKPALLKVYHEIARALDEIRMAALALLYLSTTIDHIDHRIPQMGLQCSYGVTGSALLLIKSHWRDRLKMRTRKEHFRR